MHLSANLRVLCVSAVKNPPRYLSNKENAGKSPEMQGLNFFHLPSLILRLSKDHPGPIQ